MSDDYKIVAADLTLHAAMTHEQYRNQTIRELIEKALGSEADDYRSYDGYVAEWLKDQLKGE